jgi:hypothetical protein
VRGFTSRFRGNAHPAAGGAGRPPPARGRLADLFGGAPHTLVMSGQVHQHHLPTLDGTDHLWVQPEPAATPGPTPMTTRP